MSVRVIDTDVWSYIYKRSAEAKLYEPHLFGNVLIISFQTQAELLRGAVSAGWGARRLQHLRSRFLRYVIEHSTDALCLHWAEAVASARRNGRPIAAADAWVAATASHLGVPLITHNKNDFLGVDDLIVISEAP